jgi:hypothetical protein
LLPALGLEADNPAWINQGKKLTGQGASIALSLAFRISPHCPDERGGRGQKSGNGSDESGIRELHDNSFPIDLTSLVRCRKVTLAN